MAPLVPIFIWMFTTVPTGRAKQLEAPPGWTHVIVTVTPLELPPLHEIPLVDMTFPTKPGATVGA